MVYPMFAKLGSLQNIDQVLPIAEISRCHYLLKKEELQILKKKYLIPQQTPMETKQDHDDPFALKMQCSWAYFQLLPNTYPIIGRLPTLTCICKAIHQILLKSSCTVLKDTQHVCFLPLQFLAKTQLDFEIQPSDMVDDDDFSQSHSTSVDPEEFKIMGLAGAYVYQSCP